MGIITLFSKDWTSTSSGPPGRSLRVWQVPKGTPQDQQLWLLRRVLSTAAAVWNQIWSSYFFLREEKLAEFSEVKSDLRISKHDTIWFGSRIFGNDIRHMHLAGRCFYWFNNLLCRLNNFSGQPLIWSLRELKLTCNGQSLFLAGKPLSHFFGCRLPQVLGKSCAIQIINVNEE